MNIYENNKQLLTTMGGDSANLATDYEVRKAILELLGGDTSTCNSIYEIDKQILNIYLEGGGGTSGDITLSPITINENGVYNAGLGKGYSRVTVEVPTNPLSDITITKNGVYKAENGGYGEVTVNVVGDIDYIELRNSLTSYSDETIVELPAYTFAGCKNLTTVDLPECKNVGDKSFYECSTLSSYNLPKVEYIGVEGFFGCRSLTTVDLPKCNRIAVNAFYNTGDITTVNLPKVEYIGDYCFSLNPLTTLDLPECKEMGYSAFENCHNLATLNLPKVEKLQDGVFREIATTTLSLPECKEMGWDVFCRCPNLTTVDLPKCYNLGNGSDFVDCPNLTTVNAPVCTNIGGETFARCSSFTSLDLRDTYYCQLADINAFSDTPFMNGEGTIYVHAAALPLFQNDTNWAMFADRFVGVGDASKPILDFSDGRLYGETATLFGDFKSILGIDSTNLTTVDLPNCEEIVEHSFSDMDALTTVDLPKCKKVGACAFWGCDSITTLNLPMCETINTSAFEGNKITTLDLPECKYIGQFAFQFSDNLTTVKLPKCEKLESGCLQVCPNIRTLYIGTELDVVCNANWPNITGEIETIYVPSNLVEEYKNAGYWRDFADKIVGI